MSPAAEPDVAPAPSPERLARREAALGHVRVYGDPVLKERAKPVVAFDGALLEEVETMGNLMDEALGAGLAATQVGILHRVIVYRVPGEAGGEIRALVNPELEWASEARETFEEGCLSLPAVWVEVERAAAVRVRARDEHGEPVTIEASGPEASVLQHEMDHLDGILLFDRIPREARRDAIKAMREAIAAGRR